MKDYLLLVILLVACTKSLVLACQCNNIGSYSDVCDGRTGQCHCKPSFVGKNCDQCKESGLSFPNCEGNQKCECHPQGTKIDLKRNGSCIKGVRRV